MTTLIIKGIQEKIPIALIDEKDLSHDQFQEVWNCCWDILHYLSGWFYKTPNLVTQIEEVIQKAPVMSLGRLQEEVRGYLLLAEL